jgi:predicted SprT family Zn-dependent metalloprotease
MALNLTRNHTTSCGCSRADGRKKLIRDITNQRFGHLVGIKKIENKKRTTWLFKCDCGNEKIVKGSYLKYGNTKSCGCLHKEKAGKYFFEDLTGKRFNKLLVISQAPSKYSKTHWNCQCDCGTIKSIRKDGLLSGEVLSCGCLHSEITSKLFMRDLTGQTFGKLTVIERVGSNKHNSVLWLC